MSPSQPPTTEDHPPPSGLTLSNLPTEIQDVIFHYIVLDSSIEELKRFRQSNRYFRDRADIHLFRTLHISASSASLERIRHISDNDRLNVHVRELVFHRGTFFGHSMSKSRGPSEVRAKDYDDFETYVVRSNRSEGTGPPVGLMRISECYANFNQELEFESRFNQDMTWRRTLRGPCSRFVKLEKLTTWGSQRDQDSKYLRRRCALTHQTWTPNYFAPYEIFDSVGLTFRPKALNLDEVNGEDFLSVISNIRGGEAAVMERFADLRYLYLSFSETVSNLEVEGTWDVFVRSCNHLESLSLNFANIYTPKILRESESFPEKTSKLLLQYTLPKLRHLDLTYAIMREDDFVSFLERHQKTLATLNLSSWPMPRDATTKQATGSIIRAFWKIGRLPMSSLETVRIRGEFSNRADGEGWTMKTWHSSKSKPPFPPKETFAREKLEAYMQSGARQLAAPVFPFPIPEEKMLDAKSGIQLQDLDRLPYELGYSDDSFSWWE